MKKIKLLMIIVGVALALGCENQPLPGPLGSVPEAPTPPAPVSLDLVKKAALGSSCASFSFESQGKPKPNYLQGIALTYTKVLCSPQSVVALVGSQSIGNANIDALAHYADLIKAQGLSVTTPQERLRQTFSLMVGSAARESSWKWCAGKDAGADNTDASTCEAGLYQTSYNGRYNRDGVTINPQRSALYSDAKAGNVLCFAAEYKGSTTCTDSNLKNWGTGEGVTFQKLSKECPGFASEYHALMVRERRTHYGPINEKKAQLTKECSSMFEAIEKIVAQNPGICSNF